jgi:hypothetical protein
MGKLADDGHGEASARLSSSKRYKSRIFKILTPNAFAFRILQTLFAKPAPVKPFAGVGGEGDTPCGNHFPKRTSLERPAQQRTSDYFFARYPQLIPEPKA